MCQDSASTGLWPHRWLEATEISSSNHSFPLPSPSNQDHPETAEHPLTKHMGCWLFRATFPQDKSQPILRVPMLQAQGGADFQLC